jgi:hypothetical protein
MTPACVASASITSAARKTTANIQGIRIDFGTRKLRIRRHSGFDSAALGEFSTAPHSRTIILHTTVIGSFL